MGRFLAAFALSALVFSTSQAAAVERTLPKRQVHSVRAVQARPDRVMSSTTLDSKRQLSVDSNFRADELIPDICKGCSS